MLFQPEFATQNRQKRFVRLTGHKRREKAGELPFPYEALAPGAARDRYKDQNPRPSIDKPGETGEYAVYQVG